MKKFNVEPTPDEQYRCVGVCKQAVALYKIPGEADLLVSFSESQEEDWDKLVERKLRERGLKK